MMCLHSIKTLTKIGVYPCKSEDLKLGSTNKKEYVVLVFLGIGYSDYINPCITDLYLLSNVTHSDNNYLRFLFRTYIDYTLFMHISS